MARLSHGKVVAETEEKQLRRVASVVAADAATPDVVVATAPDDLHNFDFLFPELQDDPANLLPVSADTVARLKTLGAAMVDPNPADQADTAGNSPIPAVYTYFGQFVDHDITLEQGAVGAVGLVADDLAPLPVEEIRNGLQNTRSATLDLDSLYGAPAPTETANPARMHIGTVTSLNSQQLPEKRPPGKDNDNDLPRKGRDASNPLVDREALIGDPRNDENTIISQLHVAFLKAHNRLVDEGRSFDEARRILRQHYQHVVVHDYLPRICDPTIVADIAANGNRWFNPFAEPFFMPVEFSAAAFRFGHTMVRAGYDFNLNFNLSGAPGTVPASLEFLFTFSALSGQLGFGTAPPDGFDTLPDNWIVEWENVAGENVPPGGMARRFDTRLAGPGNTALFSLNDETGADFPGMAAMLSIRNLLRGYLLRMPTGQAVADALGLPALTADELKAAAGPDQEVALTEGSFLSRTPLWFYLLAEARAKGRGGDHLGPVGSTIVAEVLIGLARRSADSIMRIPGWLPGLPSLQSDRFELADLLRYARVLPGGAPPTLYVVKVGDTLSRIARDELGSAGRWPEIFARNRGVLGRPDRIFPGQVLNLPAGPPIVPQLRFHVVAPGETLSVIALEHLGDASRWPEIFTLNASLITNPDVITVGQVLKLPK
jgi:nucleoid-associated protein YgaU